MDLGIRNHVAVVTGASSGIGSEIVRRLALEGCHTVIWGRDAARLNALAEEVALIGGMCMAVTADVTDSSAIDRAAAQVLARFSQVHILVNNVGGPRHATVLDQTEEEWNHLMAINLTGSFLCSKAFLPCMVEARYGRIVHVASRSHLGQHRNCGYVAAKAGVLGLTRSMALDFARSNITVNAVAPGLIHTQRVRSQANYEELRRNAIVRTPIQREGEPDDIARAVAFFAARTSGFITGEVFHVTGGRNISI